MFIQGSQVEALRQAGTMQDAHARFYSGTCDVPAYTLWLQQLWKRAADSAVPAASVQAPLLPQ